MMKIQDRAYVMATNACLIVGVASAFGFDSTGHAAWAVAGSCSGVVAITMYFIRHWRRARCEEPVQIERVSPWVGGVGGVRTSNWEHSRLPFAIGDDRLASTPQALEHSEPDPVEFVSGVLKKMQATSALGTYQLTIAKDGSITLKFTAGIEQARAIEQARIKHVPSIVTWPDETVH